MYLKQETLRMLVDPSPFLRSIAGILVTSIATVGGLADWPDLIDVLVDALHSSNPVAVEVRRVCGAHCRAR